MMRFEDLEVWKRSARLSADIYRAMQSVKDYGFRDQLTRAGLSVPSNIAEGFERESIREFVNFLSYAKGSCGELRTQIYIGMEISYIDRENGKTWIQESVEISAMLAGLIKTKRAHIADG
jgi:four helix bundle protein